MEMLEGLNPQWPFDPHSLSGEMLLISTSPAISFLHTLMGLWACYAGAGEEYAVKHSGGEFR